MWRTAALVFESVTIASLILIVGYGIIKYHEIERDLSMSRQLLIDPNARPDAWTKTEDDVRTIQICTAVRLLASTLPHARVELEIVLPSVCETIFIDNRFTPTAA